MVAKIAYTSDMFYLKFQSKELDIDPIKLVIWNVDTDFMTQSASQYKPNISLVLILIYFFLLKWLNQYQF